MKIIVLGAGAIGSLYGAKLSQLNDVVLIGKWKHADSINKNGLKITGLENKTYKIRAATKIGKIKDGTVILLTIKAQDNEKAIKSIKHLLGKNTIIICLQNGLYSENIVKNVVGKKCLVLRAITNFGAVFLKPGIIGYKFYSYTSIEKSPESRGIAENFSRCGLNAHVSNDIRYDMWKKLIFNCIVNPLTAILKVENKGICDEKLNPLKRLIIGECLKVAEKDGISFDINFLDALHNEFKSSINVSSMQQDLIKGKKTEIGYLNGAVAGMGRKFGIKCPVNEALLSLIRFLESEKIKKQD